MSTELTAIMDAESPLDAEFDALVENLLEEWNVPGVSIAVIFGPKTY